jgi:pectinesterase
MHHRALRASGQADYLNASFSRIEGAGDLGTAKLTLVMYRFAAVLLSAIPLFAAASQDTVHVVVAADGSGDFQTVQRAIDHAPVYGKKRLVIEIRPGIYHERVTVPQDKPRVTFLGSDAAHTIISFDTGASSVGGTFFSSTADIEGAGFEAAHITFENSHGPGTQAVAVMIHSDKAVFEDCRFVAWQDTLYAASGRQFYRDCFIEGHVDFIFGNAAAVFENCEIHSRGAGYITAQSRLTPDGPTGFVFDHCKITGENTGKGVYLGRPWRPYARVVYLDCWLGDHIIPAGWDNWNSKDNESTAWFGEYDSQGPGAKKDDRVHWGHSLTAAEARQFEPNTFLRGDDNWKPTAVQVGS